MNLVGLIFDSSYICIQTLIFNGVLDHLIGTDLKKVWANNFTPQTLGSVTIWSLNDKT